MPENPRSTPPADRPRPDTPYGPTRRPWGEQVPEGAAVRPPSADPVEVYPEVPPPDVHGDFPQIDYPLFEIPPTGLSEAERERALALFREYAETQHRHFMGFQANQDQSYSGALSWLLDMHSNNIGDPYASGAFTLNSKFCERAVIDWFAALWNVAWPHDQRGDLYPDRCWGYVLTMGFTEGNIYGLFNARDYLKGRLLLDDPETGSKAAARLAGGKEAPPKSYVYVDPVGVAGAEGAAASENAFHPVAFYSEDTHYSVIKAVRLLEIDTFYDLGRERYPGQCPINDGVWPEEVPSHDVDHDDPASGTIRVEDLEKLVRFFVERGHPPIVVANIGSTWKGAYDDVPAIDRMFARLGEEFPWLWERRVEYEHGHTDVRRGFWLHVDGALGAAYLPFVEMAYNRGLLPERGPIFDFRNEAVMSIGCSMHKWIGGPWPSGVFLTRKRYQLEPPDEPGFLGSLDTTLGGSRSGFSPMIFWDYVARMSYEDNMKKAVETEERTAYLEKRLRELQAWLRERYPNEDTDLWIARSRLALTVRFRQVNDTLNYKWTLDTDTLWVPLAEGADARAQLRSYSHVYLMHSVTRERIDAFVDEVRRIAEEGFHAAFPAEVDGQPNPGPTVPVSELDRPNALAGTHVPITGRGWGTPDRRESAQEEVE